MESMLADFKALHEALHAENARLKSGLAQATAQKDGLEARNVQLESQERVQLRQALAQLHDGTQGNLAADAAYLAAVQDLATSQAARVTLARTVQQLQIAAASEQSAALVAAQAARAELQGAASAHAAMQAAMQQAHEAEVAELRQESEAARRAGACAAAAAAAELGAVRREAAALAAALDKGRAIFAANDVARNEAVWKGRLRELKRELDRVKSERGLPLTSLGA